MIEKFNGIIYLVIFIVHFVGYAVYAFRCVVGTKSFLDQYAMHESGAIMVRFFGSMFIGSFVMAMYIMFIRPDGLNGTWGFFNLIFVQNLCIFIVNTYSIKIDKTGIKNDSNEGVIAPLVFTILSAILCYGLADKIYY